MQTKAFNVVNMLCLKMTFLLLCHFQIFDFFFTLLGVEKKKKKKSPPQRYQMRSDHAGAATRMRREENIRWGCEPRLDPFRKRRHEMGDTNQHLKAESLVTWSSHRLSATHLHFQPEPRAVISTFLLTGIL